MSCEHPLRSLCMPPVVLLLCLHLTGCGDDKPAATARPSAAAAAETSGNSQPPPAAAATPRAPYSAGQGTPGEPDVPADMVPHLLSMGIGRDPLDELPPGLLAAATPEQVLPALRSRDETTRRAAIRRLGQIGGKKAVQMIARAYATAEPLLVDATDQCRSVKEECLNALGRIRGAEAAALLAKLVRKQWERGPRQAEWKDFDYSAVMRSGLAAVGEHADDDQCYQIAEAIALSRTVKTSDEGWAREYAYGAYVRGQMLRAGATVQAAQIAYLLKELRATGSGHAADWEEPGIKSAQAARDSAVMGLLVAYGPAVIPYVEAELERAGPGDAPRREALQMVKRLVWINGDYRKQDAANREKARQARDKHEREMRDRAKFEAERLEAFEKARQEAEAARKAAGE